MSKHEKAKGGKAPGHLEIESRYLVRYLPEKVRRKIKKARRLKIHQGYPPDGDRFRRTEPEAGKGKTKYFRATKKRIERSRKVDIKDERERPIKKKRYRRRLKQAKEKTVTKMRVSMRAKKGSILDVDVIIAIGSPHAKPVRRRLVVEAEFRSRKRAKKFKPPKWFGENVTRKVSSRRLAEGDPLAIRVLRRSARYPG